MAAGTGGGRAPTRRWSQQLGRVFHRVGATRSMNAGCVGGTGGPELGKGRRLREKMAERQGFLLENSPRESWKEIIIFLLFLAHLCLHSQAGPGSPRALLVWPRRQDKVQRRLVISVGKVLAGAGQLSPVSLLLFLAPPPSLSALGHLPAAYPNNSQLLPTVQPLPSYLSPRSPAGPSVSPLPTNLPSCQLSSQITVLIFSLVPYSKAFMASPHSPFNLLTGLHSRPPPLCILAHVHRLLFLQIQSRRMFLCRRPDSSDFRLCRPCTPLRSACAHGRCVNKGAVLIQ